MIFSCDKTNLIDAINVVQKAVSTKSTIPVLEGILLECSDNKLILTGNDLELCIRYECEANITQAGSVVLNSRMFGDIIRKLPDAPIFIESDENNMTKIKCANVDFDIMGYASAEYPKLPEIEKNHSIHVDAGQFKSMMKQTIFAVSISDKKPILTGALLEVDGSLITMVASDGYRLAIRKEDMKQDVEKSFQAIIPGKTLNELLKIIKDEDNEIVISFSEKHVLFEFDQFIVLSRLRDGEYIHYKSVIPTDYPIEMRVNVAQFCESIDRAALIINSESSKTPLKIEIKDNQMNMTCASQFGKISDTISVDSTGGDIDIGFNHRYLWDALKACECDDVVVKLISSRNPCIITPVEGDAFLYLILPIIIQS